MMRGSRNQQGEEDVQTPFLQTSGIQDPPPFSVQGLRFKWLVWGLVGVLELTFETGLAMRTTPLIASYKEHLCAKTSRGVDTPIINCQRDHSIASELALILGVFQLLECLPMLLLSGIYGNMADKYGRRPILFLSYLGLVLSSMWTTGVVWLVPRMPLKLVWIGPVFTLIGGGASVSLAILMTSAAAVAPSTQRVSVFSFIHGTALVAAILGFGLSSATMASLGNYAAQLVGLALMSLALCLSLLLPTGEAAHPLASDPELDSTSEYTNILVSNRHAVIRSYNDLLQIRNTIPLLIAGFFATLGQRVQILILLYMPEQFSISFSEANTFIILDHVSNLLVLFIGLPLANVLILRWWNFNSRRKDIALALISSALSLAGALLLSFAPNVTAAFFGIIVFGTGIGLSSLLRSIFVGLFPLERAAFATTLISTIKSVGGTFSGPVYSYVFALSLDLDRVLQGLPFIVSAACFVIVASVLITMAKTPRVRRDIM
ncbi:MFS multidrug transporter [Botrytis cinerea]